MKRPSVPAWPLEPDDTIAAVGLVAVTLGTWGEHGPSAAALVFGSLLLLGYTMRELLALRRPRS